MRKFLFFCWMVIGCVGSAAAQDPQFSQFYANPLYLNPAFAGSEGGSRFALNHRTQWTRLSSPFVTYAVSWDRHFDALGGGVGAQAFYDRAGDGELTTLNASGIYSYQININRELAVKTGIQASYFQRSIDFSTLVFPDQIDPNPRLGFTQPTQEPIGQGTQQASFVDFSAGAVAFTDRYFGGFAVHHITEPGQSFFSEDGEGSNLSRKYTVHAGMVLPIDKYNARNPERTLSPHVMYQQQNQFNQINVGASYAHKNFVFGAMFRQASQTSDAFIFLLGVKLDEVRVGYSYDATLSDARNSARGSHEVSMVIQLPKRDRPSKSKFRSLECPDF